MWSTVCDLGTVEEHTTFDLANSDEASRKRVFVELANVTLKAQLRDQGLWFFEPARYFFAAPDSGLLSKIRGAFK